MILEIYAPAFDWSYHTVLTRTFSYLPLATIHTSLGQNRLYKNRSLLLNLLGLDDSHSSRYLVYAAVDDSVQAFMLSLVLNLYASFNQVCFHLVQKILMSLFSEQ